MNDYLHERINDELEKTPENPIDKNPTPSIPHGLLDDCKQSNHDLRVVHVNGDVHVNWCYKCGSIVIDKEYDNRLKPGYYMKMMSPEVTKWLCS